MPNRNTLIYTVLYISLLFLNCNKGNAQTNSDWPDYRGPQINGHSAANDLPIVWNDSTNISWKTPIPGKGWSSPIVLNNKIWITTALEEGKKLHLMAINATNGKKEQDILLFEKDNLQESHPLNSYASPTVAIEKDFVYAHFGSYGTACVSTENGEVFWKRTDLHCEHEVGPGSSPILHKDLLILTFDGTDVQFLVALNKKTGKTVWKTNRDVDLSELKTESRKAFTTPIINYINGKDQLISVGPHIVEAYEPLSGKRIWYANFKGFSASARPIVAEGKLFFNTGFGASTVIALKLGGQGNVSDSIAWINKKSTQARSSALYINGLLYMVNTGGQAKCFVAKTGEELWMARVGRQTSASPIYAGGKIYTFDEDGLTSVFAPGEEFAKIGENLLPDGFMASPAIVGNALFLRTKSHLYRIEK